jgi:hypothetical protein
MIAAYTARPSVSPTSTPTGTLPAAAASGRHRLLSTTARIGAELLSSTQEAGFQAGQMKFQK